MIIDNFNDFFYDETKIRVMADIKEMAEELLKYHKPFEYKEYTWFQNNDSGN